MTSEVLQDDMHAQVQRFVARRCSTAACVISWQGRTEADQLRAGVLLPHEALQVVAAWLCHSAPTRLQLHGTSCTRSMMVSSNFNAHDVASVCEVFVQRAQTMAIIHIAAHNEYQILPQGCTTARPTSCLLSRKLQHAHAMRAERHTLLTNLFLAVVGATVIVNNALLPLPATPCNRH